MNPKHLSLEANGIVIKSSKISQYLTYDLQRMVAESLCESEYLTKVCSLLEEIVCDQEQYVNDWLLEECFDERLLRELLQYTSSVKLMPQTLKIYDSGYKELRSAVVRGGKSYELVG